MRKAKQILFIRGADRSGGFLEAANDTQRKEQLVDIFNTSTAAGNHGWAEFAQALQAEGYVVEQVAEAAETVSGNSQGVPIPLQSMNLEKCSVIVFGSNNAVYTPETVSALESYVRSGDGAVFISDANFGSDWCDAPNSDQQFLDRFGLVMNQDNGTYALQRTQSDFISPTHPILEGVSPIGLMSDGAPLDITPVLAHL